jgi:hypothetical protein
MADFDYVAMMRQAIDRGHLGSGRRVEESDASAQQTSVSATDEIQNLSCPVERRVIFWARRKGA